MWENYIFNLLLQPGWLDYDHLYVFRKNLHQQEYRILRKCLDAGLNKQQISNLFSCQGALHTANLSPLTSINGKIRTDFYDDCQYIPDPSTLAPTQKNMLLLGDCFLGKQNKADSMRYTLHKTPSSYLGIQFEKIQTLLSCS